MLQSLKPLGNTYEKEIFEKYYERVNHYMPNIPKCVFENWIYRHYSDIDDYAYLDFRKMKFTKEIWNKDEIYSNINSFDDNHLIDSLGYQIYERNDKTWLQKFFLSNYTWPVPIIVLDNNSIDELGKPYHLLEGHLRLNYFRTIYRKEKDVLLEEHQVWKVTI